MKHVNLDYIEGSLDEYDALDIRDATYDQERKLGTVYGVNLDERGYVPDYYQDGGA